MLTHLSASGPMGSTSQTRVVLTSVSRTLHACLGMDTEASRTISFITAKSMQ